MFINLESTVCSFKTSLSNDKKWGISQPKLRKKAKVSDLSIKL